jgi:hypothetical protein
LIQAEREEEGRKFKESKMKEEQQNLKKGEKGKN